MLQKRVVPSCLFPHHFIEAMELFYVLKNLPDEERTERIVKKWETQFLAITEPTHFSSKIRVFRVNSVHFFVQPS
jgi:hypothetical protein